MGFHLLDRITDFERGRRASCVKVIPYGDDRLVIAPSGRKVFPRTLVLEGIVQLASRMLAASNDFSVVPILGRMEEVVFHRDALPGDMVTLEVEISGMNEDGAFLDGRALVNAQPIAELHGLLCPFSETERLVETRLAKRVFEELQRGEQTRG